MALRDIFTIREGKAEHYGLDPSAELSLRRFLRRYSRTIEMPGGEETVADYLLYVDDMWGDGSLRDAIEAGDTKVIDAMVKGLFEQFPPEEFPEDIETAIQGWGHEPERN